jgi:hypothetical protein
MKPRTIRLEAKTARGRQLIREWGDVWTILRLDNVAFAKGQHALVAPDSLLEGESRDRASRWVKIHNDKNFFII